VGPPINTRLLEDSSSKIFFIRLVYQQPILKAAGKLV